MAIEATTSTPGQTEPSSYRTQGELPLVVHADGNPGVDGLLAWLTDQVDHVREQLTQHGAILFRGFDVTDAGDFERIARAIDDGLKNQYMGLSPRDALTDYVFTASEIPELVPDSRAQRNELRRQSPAKLFFWCQTEPAAGSGETPLVDMRQVYKDLDPEVRERFEKRGIRVVRNYRAPGKKRPWDLTQLKPWVDMFQTTDRAVVEDKCASENFTPVWGEDNSLKLLSSQPAAKAHPKTGEMVWFNHAAVLHTSIGDGRASPDLSPETLGQELRLLDRRKRVHCGSAAPAKARRPPHALHLRGRDDHSRLGHGGRPGRHLEEPGDHTLEKRGRPGDRQRLHRPRPTTLLRATNDRGCLGLGR